MWRATCGRRGDVRRCVYVCMYVVDLVGEWEERSFLFPSLFCFKLIFFSLTLPDPPRINVDGMICNRCM